LLSSALLFFLACCGGGALPFFCFRYRKDGFFFPVRWLRGISFWSVTYFGVSFPFARHLAPGHGDV
jgi:hypothetical protein